MNCLVDYFESSNWKSELNTQNPLGMHGEMAIAFAELVHVIWKGEVVSFSPSKLKSVIGQFAHQFSGNEQQDVHELITFLLDGVHEDLNRRINKPMIENVFGNGTNDEETAEKSWHAHKLRNDSVIVDLFHGQLRSKLDCPRCKCTTTVFDPYITLSVPLVKPENSSSQQNRQKKLKITYIPHDFSQKYKFFILDIKGNENVYDIVDMIQQKVKTKKAVVLGRYDQVSNEMIWGLPNKETQKKKKKKKTSKNENFSDEENWNSTSFSNRPHSHSIFDGVFDGSDENSDNDNDDDDSGEYIAFEIVEADYNLYWIPCFLKMKIMDFLSSTEKNIIGPFLLPCVDESPSEKELSDICETVISSIWEEYPESESENDPKNKTESQSASDVDSDFISDDSIIQSESRFKPPSFVNKKIYDGGKNFLSKKIFSDYSFEDDSRVKVTKDGDIIFDENFQLLANNFVTARISKKATEEKNFSLKRLLVNFDQRALLPLSMSNPFDKERIEKVSLEKCLKYFSMKETLDSKNMWFCPHCREFVCAEKKMDIWSTPKNLILHLKRFITAEYSFGQIDSKLTTRVDYPLLLDMDPYIIGPNKKSSNLYRLKAVSEHVGTAGGGHYTAVALVDENYRKNKFKKKSRINNSESESDSDDECLKWYFFNDSIVTKVSKENAVSKDAYVLFYERMYDDHGDKNNDNATDYDPKSSSSSEEEEEEEEAKVDNSYSSEHQSNPGNDIDDSANSNDNDDETTANEDDIDNEKEYEETVNENKEKGSNEIINSEKNSNKFINQGFNEKNSNEFANSKDNQEMVQNQFFNNESIQFNNAENSKSLSQINENQNNYESNIQIKELNSSNNNGEKYDNPVENEEEEEEEANDAKNNSEVNHQSIVNAEEQNQQPFEQRTTTEVVVRNEFVEQRTTFIQQTPKMDDNRERNHFTSNDDDDENDDVDDDVDNSNCHVF